MFSDSRVKLTSKLPSTSIHVLDDDSLLNIFRCYRPIAFDSDSVMDSTIRMSKWDRERWWYRLVQVCRRWRYLILGSASYLRLCLVCTLGTPVADMLESSPPLPLVVSYNHPHRFLTAGEEKVLLFALQQRDRIRTIYLQMPLRCLRKIVTAFDDKFPMLELLYIRHPAKGYIPLTLPPTFEAPHLRHLNLHQFAVPMGSPLFTTAIGLMTLILRWDHPLTYSDPNYLLQTLSPLSQLHTLEIGFSSSHTLSSHDIPQRLSDAPTMAHVTLSNLRWFSFWGISDYLEAILPHMTVPCLTELKVHFFNHFGLSVPRLLQFVKIAENLRFGSAKFVFHHRAVGVFVYPHVGTNLPRFNFFVEVPCMHLDQQVSSVAQIFSVLSPLFSTVMDLTLDYKDYVFSSEQHDQANRMRWRELLGSFRNVTTLRVHKGLVGELSHSLRSDVEPTLEVLPDLKELVCPTRSLDEGVFTAFIHDREVAGHPVKLTGETFPAGYFGYSFDSPGGVIHIDPDTP